MIHRSTAAKRAKIPKGPTVSTSGTSTRGIKTHGHGDTSGGRHHKGEISGRGRMHHQLKVVVDRAAIHHSRIGNVVGSGGIVNRIGIGYTGGSGTGTQIPEDIGSPGRS